MDLGGGANENQMHWNLELRRALSIGELAKTRHFVGTDYERNRALRLLSGHKGDRDWTSALVLDTRHHDSLIATRLKCDPLNCNPFGTLTHLERLQNQGNNNQNAAKR